MYFCVHREKVLRHIKLIIRVFGEIEKRESLNRSSLFFFKHYQHC